MPDRGGDPVVPRTCPRPAPAMQRESAATAFQITCPHCGQRLRFATGAEVPGRIRIQCSACGTTFAVRRPGRRSDLPAVARRLPDLHRPAARPVAGPGSHVGSAPNFNSGGLFQPRRGDQPAPSAHRHVPVRRAGRAGPGGGLWRSGRTLRSRAGGRRPLPGGAVPGARRHGRGLRGRGPASCEERVALKTVRAEVAGDRLPSSASGARSSSPARSPTPTSAASSTSPSTVSGVCGRLGRQPSSSPWSC